MSCDLNEKKLLSNNENRDRKREIVMSLIE